MSLEEPSPPRVFISYSHDSPEHAARVDEPLAVLLGAVIRYQDSPHESVHRIAEQVRAIAVPRHYPPDA